MSTVLLYALLTTAMFYLGSRAVITAPIWSRYPRKLAALLDCAACSGFWMGLVAAFVLKFPLLGLDGDHWLTPVVAGLCAMIWTPLVAVLHQTAMIHLGSTLDEEG